MKIKLNTSILKGRNVKFRIVDLYPNAYVCDGVVVKAKEKGGDYKIEFDNGRSCKISGYVLAKMKVEEINEQIVLTCYDSEKFIGGLVGFTMADTYGFPVEITEEILAENGYTLDVEGFRILKKLQEDMSAGTFKNKDGWNSGNMEEIRA